MKVLVGIPDLSPYGFHHTDPMEMVRLGATLCRTPSCGCDRSWTGIHTKKGATLAKVVAPPPCFNLKQELATDPLVMAAIAIAAQHPVGVILRPCFDWEKVPDPSGVTDDELVAGWVVTAVGGGPN